METKYFNSFVLIVLCLLLSACNQKKFERGYYRYPAGLVHIEKAKIVAFMHEEDPFYVCPDSAVDRCCDPDWRNRKDVYHYSMACGNFGEKLTYGGIPEYIDNNFDYIKLTKRLNDSICIASFALNPEEFMVYFEANILYWYDPTDPYFENPYADQYNAFAFSENYRLSVVPNYTFYQSLRLMDEFD